MSRDSDYTPDPAWDAEREAIWDAIEAGAAELARMAEDADGPPPPTGPHHCVICSSEIAYPGICGECGCEDDGDIY